MRVEAARAAEELQVTLEDVRDDDVLELELDGGIRLWTSLA